MLIPAILRVCILHGLPDLCLQCSDLCNEEREVSCLRVREIEGEEVQSNRCCSNYS